MARWCVPLFLWIFLMICLASQGQTENISGHIPINEQSQRDEHPSNNNKISDNLPEFDCFRGQHTALRSILPDEVSHQTCANMKKWVEARHKVKPKPKHTDIMKMERELYRNLGRPYPSAEDAIERKARKEYRMMTDEERESFHDALNFLKRYPVGDSNYYDSFSDFHLAHVSPAAHWGPGFFGWHKQYLLRMESALQAVDPTVTIPYWDATLDSHLVGQEADSILWTDDFLGNRAGFVETGPFANWRTPRKVVGGYNLKRGNATFSPITIDMQYDYVMAIDDFRGLTSYIDNSFEYIIHGWAHAWVGGAMSEIENSPLDPVFFMHHSFIDMMWDAQREIVYKNGGRDKYVYPSIDDDEAFGVGIDYKSAKDSPHYPLTKLSPFDILNKDALDEKYMTTYYYEAPPKCSPSNLDCGSPYLFCIIETYKCAPKLISQAKCEKYATSDCCYKGKCVDGYCQPE